MTTRRNLGGRYVEVRERNTSKGHKGTILKNWSSKQNQTNESSANLWAWGIVFIIFLLLLWLIYMYFLK